VFLGIITYFTHTEPTLLWLVVGISIFTCMIMAASIGAFVPLLLKRFDIDAAIATGPFVTTSIDIIGVFVYFWVAKLFLGL